MDETLQLTQLLMMIPTPTRPSGSPVELAGRGRDKAGEATSAEMPSLSVAAIRMPSTAIEQQSGVTYFGVEVMPESSAGYRVQKRYQDFEALKNRLHRIAPWSMIMCKFPRKHVFGCEGTRLEERRRGLEQWLKSALNHPCGPGPWCLELRDFLEVGKLQSLAFAQALASAPEAPPETPAEAPEALEGPMQILVPEGVVCGDTLAVKVPDGRELTVSVPAGVASGSELMVWFDPVAGTLSPLV